MSDCREVRWQFNEFLAGKLSPEQDARVRTHFDECPRCVGMLTIGHRIENHLQAVPVVLSPDFTKRVVGEFPVAGIGATVTRYLIAVFGASATVAAAAYWVFSQFVKGSGESAAARIGSAPETINIALAHWLAEPMTRHFGLALLALALCVVLVLVVDMPRRSNKSEQA